MINQYITKVLPSFLDQDEDLSEQHPMLTTQTFTTYTKVGLPTIEIGHVPCSIFFLDTEFNPNNHFQILFVHLVGHVCATGRCCE